MDAWRVLFSRRVNAVGGTLSLQHSATRFASQSARSNEAGKLLHAFQDVYSLQLGTHPDTETRRVARHRRIVSITFRKTKEHETRTNSPSARAFSYSYLFRHSIRALGHWLFTSCAALSSLRERSRRHYEEFCTQFQNFAAVFLIRWRTSVQSAMFTSRENGARCRRRSPIGNGC